MSNVVQKCVVNPVPFRCKPSGVVSTDATKPALCGATVQRDGEALVLWATDSYKLLRLPLVKAADLGPVWIPEHVLIEVEKGARLSTDGDKLLVDRLDGGVTHYESDPPTYRPDYEKVYEGEPIEEPLQLGLNTRFLRDLAEGMGSESVVLTIDLKRVSNGAYHKPIRVRPTAGWGDGLLMPLRVYA